MNADFLFARCLDDACVNVGNGPALEDLDDETISKAIAEEMLKLYRERGERLGITFDE